MCLNHDPLLCVIPPHMLDRMIEKGTDDMRRSALETIKRSNHLRAMRAVIGEQARASVLAMAPGIDAHSAERVRELYDAEQGETLPGKLVRGEMDPATGDAAADESFDAAGHTWDLYQEVYGRNSLDDRGMVLTQTVHFGQSYNNAFWNGEQMVYGDGDGELFGRFTTDIDIIGHELTHGVVQFEAGLRYWYQSGALNESFADVFGSLVKQRSLGQDVQAADWFIGATVLLGDGFALRSMKAPGTAYVNHPILGDDPQPATMDDYRELQPWEDNGGVHINSGIPNFAFYTTAMELGGYAWEKAGLIWYRALCEKLDIDSSFQKAARATVQVAREEFGAGSLEEKAVEKGWKAAKVL